MNDPTKQLPTRTILMLPGQSVQFDLLDATLFVTARMQGSCMRIDYQLVKHIPALLDVQRN